MLRFPWRKLIDSKSILVEIQEADVGTSFSESDHEP